MIVKGIESLEIILKDQEYFGYKFNNCFLVMDADATEITFKNEKNSYFKIVLSNHFCRQANPEKIIEQVELMINNMPEFAEQAKKTKHHKEFYDKFDKVLNEL